MSQQYLVPCECGQTTPVTAAQAGRIIQCSCGRDIKVPTLSGLRQLAPPAKEEESFPKAPRSNTAWSGSQGAMFVIGVVLAIIGLFFGGYNSYIVRQIDTEDHTAHVQEVVEQDIDTLKATDIVELFDYIKSKGIGETGTAQHVILRQISGQYFTAAAIGFGAALIGIVLAAASIVNPGKK